MEIKHSCYSPVISKQRSAGEIVLVWPGGGIAEEPVEDQLLRAIALACRYREEGMSARDASARAAGETNTHRRAIYQGLLEERHDTAE